MKNLSEVTFKNAFTENFEGDDSGVKTPRQTPGKLYSKAMPTPVNKVTLLAWSEELANDLGVIKPTTDDNVNILGGNLVTPTMQPYAACYGGHQFGNWAGQLGDGRAITLGEVQATDNITWELQLKGPGKTPYSRTADGRAVLRSSVREYLMSEAMHHLGVPTTRALSLVSTGDKVMRDMFYDGNAEYEQGAIVMRAAPTFLRFGNFEILTARQEIEHLSKLVNWTIEKHYPHIQTGNKILTWYREVVERTAHMVVEWLRVGFVHGVMNTDNMSILGLTIDYGPYSFVDDYDPNFTPNTTDLPGRRYAFGKQAAVAKWNLACLAGAIAPLIESEDELRAALESYDKVYWKSYFNMMANKLGLDEIRQNDSNFLQEFEKMLTSLKPDMTIFYQLLIDLPRRPKESDYINHFRDSFYAKINDEEIVFFNSVMKRYVDRLQINTISNETSQEKMRTNNPRFILRNYLLHQAIEQLEKGDSSLFENLQEAMKKPYSNKFDEYFAKRPEWATKKAGCSMLSCSS